MYDAQIIFWSNKLFFHNDVRMGFSIHGDWQSGAMVFSTLNILSQIPTGTYHNDFFCYQSRNRDLKDWREGVLHPFLEQRGNHKPSSLSLFSQEECCYNSGYSQKQIGSPLNSPSQAARNKLSFYLMN